MTFTIFQPRQFKCRSKYVIILYIYLLVYIINKNDQTSPDMQLHEYLLNINLMMKNKKIIENRKNISIEKQLQIMEKIHLIYYIFYS